MIGYGTHDQPAGTWSDDSSMTIATMEWLGEKENTVLDYTLLMDKFSNWLIHGDYVSFKDFIDKYKQFRFSIMDETYGYNLAKYNGYLLSNQQHYECIIEIYHEGDMVFVVDEFTTNEI